MQEIRIALAGFDVDNVVDIELYVKRVLASLIPGTQIDVALTFVSNFFELDSLHTNFIVANKEVFEYATLPKNIDVHFVSQSDFESANGSSIPASLHLLSQAILRVLKENPEGKMRPLDDDDTSPTLNSNPRFFIECREAIHNALCRENDQFVFIEDRVRGLIRQLSQLKYSGWTLTFLMIHQGNDKVLERKIKVPGENEQQVAIPSTNSYDTASLTSLEVFISSIGLWLVKYHKQGYAFRLLLTAPAS